MAGPEAAAAAGRAANLASLSQGSVDNRVKPGVYTSPSGKRIEFKFTDVRREVTKRGTVFEFSGIDGGYVQRKGFGPRRYPLRCFFSGPRHDLFALAFEAALLEDGVGQLQHPLYGTFPAVPFGDITRRDDLVNEVNQSVVEATFWTTLKSVYPQGQTHPRSEILAALGAFDAAAAQQFADSMNLAGAVEKAAAKATLEQFIRDIGASLDGVSEAVTSINREFRAVQSAINAGIDVFIGKPLLLAQQVSNLIKLPGRALTGFQSRLDGYGDLADRIFGSSSSNPGDRLGSGTALLERRTAIANDFHIADHVLMSAVGGGINAVASRPVAAQDDDNPEATFKTKPQVFQAIEAITAQYDALVTWRDDGFEALEGIPELGTFQVDPGDAIQQLEKAVALCSGFLVEASFSLVPERAIVLDRPRTLVDLAAELYGEVDNRIDDLIKNNDLTGDEILEVDRGRKILYYPPKDRRAA